ncbi:MAG: carboxy terminal-processing peptidase [Verrucomicrobia bacterium]|nr:carboxy terminal-processing peptidase [Verrucomicrobiota bacterium]
MKNISIAVAAGLLLFNSVFVFGDDKPNSADPRQVAITVGRLLEQGHYSRQKLDAETSKRILETYLENLDYNKLFFNQEDVDQFNRKYGANLGDSILLGDLQPAREIYSVFKVRVEDRIGKIRQLLKKDYTFKSSRTVALDRRKEPWPVNIADADTLWKDRIEGELLQEKLNKLAVDPGPKVVGRRYDQLLKSVEERDDDDLVQVFLNSVAQSYDPHSEYLGRSDLESFEINMRLSLTGIGAELRSDDGYAKVQRLLPGGPAQMSGKMSVGDRIAAVAQGKDAFVDTVDMKLDKVVEMIRGKKGTIVRLQLIPANANDPSKRRVVELVRDNVKLTEQEAKAEIIEKNLPDGSIQKLGWITLPSFYQDMEKSRTGKSTSRDVAALLKRLEQEQVQGLIVDLRRDGGGSLDEAIKMSGLFINQGPVVQVKDANGDIDVLKDREGNALYNGPMIVLVNKLSASASEIFAAAMQDYGRALIVGDSSTFGKGTVQTMLELGRFMPMLGNSSNDAGALKLTVQKFYRVAGGSTQLRGVISDIKLPSLTDNSEFGETALQHPLAYDEVEPAPIDVAANRKPLFVDQLRQRSANRVSQDAQFQDITDDLRQLDERLKVNRLSLNESVRRDEMAKEVRQREKEEADRKKAQFDDHDKTYELTLADLDKPQLKLSEQKSDLTPGAKSAKAKPMRSADNPVDAALDDDDSTSLVDSDSGKRETLNILSDLIGLGKSQQRTVGR